jgi:DMSO/TMAO reductase YedYZ molybdopterin-dependent catalytic subunit
VPARGDWELVMSDEAKYQPGDPLRPEQQPPGVVISPDTRRANRIPPGQSRTRKWPILHATTVPPVDLATWTLDIRGEVDRPYSLTWAEFRALPRIRVFADFHCVTRWSRLGNIWEGVAVRELLARAGVRTAARYLLAGGCDCGWTTNLPITDCLVEDALVADTHDGEPLDPDHGGPARLIIPHLYAWKSAKWLTSLELLTEDQRGFWEAAGYHDRGDPWQEERFNDSGMKSEADL